MQINAPAMMAIYEMAIKASQQMERLIGHFFEMFFFTIITPPFVALSVTAYAVPALPRGEPFLI